MPRMTDGVAVLLGVVLFGLLGCVQVAEVSSTRSEAATRFEQPRRSERMPARATSVSGQESTKGADGAEMVLVAAGDFWMGSGPAEVDACKEERIHPSTCAVWGAWESPRHRVVLDAFYIDRYEVTNALFARFVGATGYETTAEREGWGWGA